MVPRLPCLAALALVAQAQTVDIYSEFSRVDPFGQVVAADRGWHRREVLSPAVARNSFAAFHVVVSVPENESYLLYVGTNPLDACRVSLYKEHFILTADGWIPDRLSEVHRLPDFGTMPDPDDGIRGQTTRVYLLEVWIPPDAPVRRFRLEVQLKVAYWDVRPMEVRVLAARVPEIPQKDGAPLPPIEAGADVSAVQPLMQYLAGATHWTVDRPLTVRGIIRRNAVQDMALAGTMDMRAAGPEALARRALDLVWNNLQLVPRVSGAEWYLRLRDYLDAR